MSLEQCADGESVISLRGVGAARSGRELWSGVDLDVGPGRFVAVLGPNGVGKSTLLGMLLGELPPARGAIRVLGEAPGRRNAEVGYMPQRRSFDPGMQVRGRDVVGLGIDGARWGFPLPGSARFTARGRERARRIEEVIDLVGASGYADRPVGHCSGGEQQRLLIAQALAARPRLLLLDEPLDSLDLPNQSGVASLIASIAADQGIAVVIVAHDVNPILSHLDTVVYLAPGACEVGDPARVITSERLTRLFGTPIDVLTAGDGRTVVVGQPRPDHAPPTPPRAVASGAGAR